MCVCGGGGGGGGLSPCFVEWLLLSLSNLSIILLGKRELYLNLFVGVCVLCLFLTVPWVGLQSMIVAFPGQTHLLLTQ